MENLGRSLKSQFKQADRLNSRFFIILNDEELESDQIKIKDNQTKEETLVGVDYILYYFEEKLSEELLDEVEGELDEDNQ
jgi:histidyl-tRNA synthetase